MEQNNCNINNIYQLDGTVPLGKAIPFGLQHIGEKSLHLLWLLLL